MPTLRIAILLALLSVLPARSIRAADKVDWAKDVWPFIERSCVDCHKEPYEEGGKTKEPKAELRFDGAWAILKGGENGPILVAGKSADSDMYFRVTLPDDDSDFMPSKGEVLTDKEKELLKAWIDQGADFGDWEGNLKGKPVEVAEEPTLREVKPLAPSVYELLSKKTPAADDAAVKALIDSGALVEPLSVAVNLYRVDFFNSRDNTADDSLASLAGLKKNIAQLNLGESGVTDDGLKQLSGLSNLVRLDLHQTSVSDAGIDHLLGLGNLEYLNLYGTKVSDKGLRKLAGLKNLKAVYLWKTEVSEGGVKRLEKALPGARVNWR